MTPEISYISLVLCALLLIIPAFIIRRFKIGIGKELLAGIIRMSVQLFLVGIFLTYIFELNNIFLTIAWILTMSGFATHSAIKGAGLKIRHYIIPMGLALLCSALAVLMYFNFLVLRLDNILDARFAIALGGMLLGNSMRGIIIGVSTFFKNVKRNTNRYLYSLSLGASVLEASMPMFASSLRLSLKPTLASMATMGIVFLPGMMSGQIIAGQSPLLAIKYQIAIMIAIFTSSVLAIMLAIVFSYKKSFDEFGMLKKEMFNNL